MNEITLEIKVDPETEVIRVEGPNWEVFYKVLQNMLLKAKEEGRQEALKELDDE
jgi:hypothetical protein